MALLQAAQMETQRKTAKDQQDGQLDMAKQQDESQRKILELQQKTEEAEKDRQANFALNTQDNLTQERIKAADLTVDGAKLRQEQMKTVREANREVQQNLGE
jgi:C4-type Zn-finger protein